MLQPFLRHAVALQLLPSYNGDRLFNLSCWPGWSIEEWVRALQRFSEVNVLTFQCDSKAVRVNEDDLLVSLTTRGRLTKGNSHLAVYGEFTAEGGGLWEESVKLDWTEYFSLTADPLLMKVEVLVVSIEGVERFEKDRRWSAVGRQLVQIQDVEVYYWRKFRTAFSLVYELNHEQWLMFQKSSPYRSCRPLPRRLSEALW